MNPEEQIFQLQLQIDAARERLAQLPANPANRTPSQRFVADGLARQIRAMQNQIFILSADLPDEIPF